MIQLNTKKNALFAKPFLVGLITFMLLASICAYVTYQRYMILKNEEREQALNITESIRSRLQQALQYSLSATQAMTLLIDKEGVPGNFDSIAPAIFKANKYIDAIELVPGGVIRDIYPKKSNEVVMDYNILRDSTRNKEAYKAIEKKQLFFAGPFELRQGGMGIVGRLPVFINDKFWGFSAVVIRLGTLFNAAGIDTIGKTGYYFQLSKINPDTGKEEFFLPFRGFSARHYEVAVPVPDGEWKLSVIPVNGYKSLEAIIPISLLGLVLSLLGAILAGYISKTPLRLQQLVSKRTAELDKSEKRNKAIVNVLPDMLFVIDREGHYIDFNNPSGQQTFVNAEQFISKKVTDILSEHLAAEVMACVKKVIQTGEIVTHSYDMEMDGEIRSYESRYVRQRKDDVLVLVRDITETKKTEKKIKESEEKYRTLVEQATDCIFIADFKGNFLIVNPACSRVSQYSEEELLKMTIYDLAIAEELKEMPFKFDEVATGKTVITERKMRLKNGRITDVEVSAKIISGDRFLVFVKDISERKKVENELLKSREDLRQLSNHLENVREEERVHIAREIHDELGQHLTVLKMNISFLGKNIIETDNRFTDDVNKILDLINDMVKAIRKISYDLRPGLLDQLGLVSALEWYSNDFEKRTGIRTAFITEFSDTDLPEKTRTGLFRIFQESLTNVARHAEAKRVDVSLSLQDQELVMLIEDDGKGFNPSSIADQKTLGILGMRERAIMMGGTYTIHSSPGKGTIIDVAVPFSTN